MAALLSRLGRHAFRRRRLVVRLWALTLVLLAAAELTFGGTPTDAVSVPGSQSAEASAVIAADLPEVSGATLTIVVKSAAGTPLSEPAPKAAVQAVLTAAAGLPGVSSVTSPFDTGLVDRSGTVGLIAVQYAGSLDSLSSTERSAYTALSEISDDTLIVVPGGAPTGAPAITVRETLGLAAAMVIIALALGSLIAAGLTTATTLVGAATGMCALITASSAADLPGTAQALALMLGLVAGLGFALSLLSRHQAQLTTLLPPPRKGQPLDHRPAPAPPAGRHHAEARASAAHLTPPSLHTPPPTAPPPPGRHTAPSPNTLTTPGRHHAPSTDHRSPDALATPGHAPPGTLTGPGSPSSETLTAPGRHHASDSDHPSFSLSRHPSPLPDLSRNNSTTPPTPDLAERLIEQSVVRATATVGPAVLITTLIAVIAFGGLALIGVPYLTAIGAAVATTMVTAAAATLTLLPALLGFAGRQVMRPRGAHEPPPRRRDLGRRWVRGVVRFRTAVIVLLLGLLALASFPARDLRLALPDDGTAPSGSARRVAYDMISESFGAGANGPVVVVLRGERGDTVSALAGRVNVAVRQMPDVGTVQAGASDAAGTTRILSVVPGEGPGARSTVDLVRSVREAVAPMQDEARVYVTGPTAVGIDLADRIRERLRWYVGVVALLAILLMVALFRSVLVPVKAVVSVVPTVTATTGLLAAISSRPLVGFLPIVLAAVLFALAMGYETIILAQVREKLPGGGAVGAIGSGVGRGARAVTVAALAMTVVLAVFVLVADPVITPISLALALGVLIDVFAVRLTLGPALLALLGTSAWSLRRPRGAPEPPPPKRPAGRMTAAGWKPAGSRKAVSRKRPTA